MQTNVMKTFIVAPCNMESIYCSLNSKYTYYYTSKSLNLHENTHNDRSYMFRSSIILREIVQSLPKVTLLLKHSVKLRRFIFVEMWQHVVKWLVYFLLCRLHNKQHTRHFTTCCHISTNIQRRNFTECINRSVTSARLCTSSLRMVENRNI